MDNKVSFGYRDPVKIGNALRDLAVNVEARQIKAIPGGTEVSLTDAVTGNRILVQRPHEAGPGGSPVYQGLRDLNQTLKTFLISLPNRTRFFQKNPGNKLVQIGTLDVKA